MRKKDPPLVISLMTTLNISKTPSEYGYQCTILWNIISYEFKRIIRFVELNEARVRKAAVLRIVISIRIFIYFFLLLQRKGLKRLV